MSNIEAWTTVVSLLLPLLIAVLKQQRWDDTPLWTDGPTGNDLIAVVTCLVVAGGAVYYKGAFDLSSVVVVVAKVLTEAFVAYKMFWQATGIDTRVMRITSP